MGTKPGAANLSALEVLRERISWLVRLRWIAALGVLATVSLAPRFLAVSLNQSVLYSVMAGLAGYNVAMWAIIRWVPPATRGPAVSYFANIQIAVDLVFLSALLHFSGGVENPFAVYYVFHIVIASILLSRAATYFQATLAVGLFTATAALEATGVLRHHHVQGLFNQELYCNRAYVMAILFCTGSMLYLCAFMATSITSRLRRREAQIVSLSASVQAYAEDLKRTYDGLRQLETARSEYLHRAAHHLRSPLGSLERMLAVVSEGRTGQMPERAREMIERARLRVRNMLDLARDLLLLSRASAIAPLARQDTVDLAGILRDMAGEFRQQASLASVSVVVSAPAAAGVRGDLEALMDLVDNLVSNAIKYTPAGGKVQIGLARAGDHIELRVSDTGIGIPPDEQARIFDEFYRATNARDSGKEGTGLGMSIVKAIAEAHGGTVSLESQVGAGTTFSVLLPAAVNRP